jgi:hypothetical protein
MQFKKMGKRIQILAYRGYDKDKRRSVIKMVGSFDAYTLEASAELLESLTDDEKIELQSYIENVRQGHKKEYDSLRVSMIGKDITKVSELIQSEECDNLSAQWANEAWLAMDKLQKALRKRGLNRPPKQKIIKKNLQDSTTQQAGLDLG